MFLQFNISPVHKPKKSVMKPVVKPEEVPVLYLAPFTPIPKICFDNVLIGTTVTKTLIIKNPTPNDIMLYVTKAPPDERRVAFNWEKCVVCSHSDTVFELIWNASSEGGWKDTLTFQDGGRLKKDVAVIFKAVKPQKTRVKPKRVIKCVSTKVKSPKQRFSPKRKSPKMLSSTITILPDITNIPEITIDSTKNVSYSKHITEKQQNFAYINKENFDISGIENLSSIMGSVLGSPCRCLRNNILEYPRNTKRLNVEIESFDDSLEINESVDHTPNYKSNKHDLFNDSNRLKSYSIEDKLKQMEFTPTLNTFQPSVCSTDEKSYDENISKKRLENVLNECISSSTFSVDKKNSPNIEEKLANISSDTYIKGNISSETYTKGNTSSDTFIKGNVSSSTYIKDGVSPETSFDEYFPSPISFETIQIDEVVRQPEFSRKRKQFLEQIKEESHISFNNSQANSTNETRKRRSEECFKTVSPKRKTVEFNTSKNTNSRTLKGFKSLNLQEVVKQYKEPLIIEEETSKQTSKHFEIQSFPTQNPFILTATNSIDPFMSSTMYYDPRWVDEQTESFKKWLNALLTPPEELDSNAEGNQMDVAKLWQDCKKREVLKAPTKEVVSSKYHTKGRLQTLRRNAENYFRSPEISSVLSKVCMMIENNKLIIRDDKDIHLDLGLQAEITVLFLSYNPLWLRIGLETVYNVTIPLNSNSDVVGLVMFLSENFFKDQYLLKKYKSVHAKKYSYDIKKMVLKKFLMFIFFLDKAKENKLIPHDPCLFCRNAPFKDSRSIILKFARELLSSIGDVTKIVKCTGYILTHKQIYINEFDYAITNVGADLRDGVRLTKIMEIILLVDGLVNGLRVPAISRLQKIHNVKIAFDALKRAGFEILYEIEPKDIVDGHREKTLSFLWQIIYKFQAPRITKAVCIIQHFWRSLRVTINRRILQRERLKREKAAITIQRWYRRLLLARQLNKIVPIIQGVLTNIRREKAARTIQSNFRRASNRKRYLNLRKLTIGLQSYARKYLTLENINFKITAIIRIQAFFRMRIARKYFIKIKAAVTYIEDLYLAKRKMKIELNNYQTLKNTTLYVQSKFRAKLAMKRDMQLYAQTKYSIINIQRRIRATKLMRFQQNYYLSLKFAVTVIQRKYRAKKLGEIDRNNYFLLKMSVKTIEKIYIANKMMKKQRLHFLNTKKAVLFVENKYLAKKLGREQFTNYRNIKQAVKIIKDKFRANREMTTARSRYTELKNAAIKIQARFRANKLAKIQRRNYLLIAESVVTIQQWYKATKMARVERKRYLELKGAARIIETRFIANKLMKHQRRIFLSTKKAVRFIEDKFVAKKLCKLQLKKYCAIKEATAVIQNRFKANKQMKEARESYLELKETVIIIQRKFRANKLTKIEQYHYLQLKKTVNIVQTRFRSNRLMRKNRIKYLELKKSALIVQQRYRANKLRDIVRQNYLELKNAVQIIENRLEANKLGNVQRQKFLALKKAVHVVEERFTAKKLSQIEYKRYTNLKSAAIVIQRRFRAIMQMKSIRQNYLQLMQTVTNVQNRYRAKMLTKTERCRYLQYKNAVNVIKTRYRANKLMQLERKKFLECKKAVIVVQQCFRSNKLAQTARMEYLNLKKSVLLIENMYISRKIAQKQFEEYKIQKQSAITIQRSFRAYILTKKQRLEYIRYKNAVICIQERFRANKLAQIEKTEYTKLRKACQLIQCRFKAKFQAKLERSRFLEIKKAAVTIQLRFQATKTMKVVMKEYSLLRNSTILIQRRYRANCLMKIDHERFRIIRESVIIIQRRFRATKIMKIHRSCYQKLRSAVLIIQRRYRAMKLMKFEKKRYETLKIAVRKLEERYIANKLMKEVLSKKLIHSAIYIQNHYRGLRLTKQIRQNFLHVRNCVIAMQRRFRSNKEAKTQRLRYLTLRHFVILIQRIWREGRLVRKRRLNITIVQAFVRGFIARKKFRRSLPALREERRISEIQRKAATKIQTYWRGYITRSKEVPELTKIRLKAKVANTKVQPEKTLAYKKEKALNALINENTSLEQIITALRDLDYITRRCKDTCVNMSKLLPEDLYRIITSSSRSLPEMQSCTAATGILINFCKYPQTTAASWCPDYLDSIVTVMIHWCDKEYPLFLYLSTLIWLLAHNPQQKRVIKRIPNISQRLLKMKQLCDRKRKMALKMSSKGNDLFSLYKNLPLPLFAPDWGLEYSHKPRTFQNSVHAMESVLNILDMSFN